MTSKILQEIRTLAQKMTEKAPGYLRIAFGEAGASKKTDDGAGEFLKAGERRLGRDFRLYALMARMCGEVNTYVQVLEEMVMPISIDAPAAYDEGLTFLEGKASVFGESAQEWKNLIGNLRKNPSPSL